VAVAVLFAFGCTITPVRVEEQPPGGYYPLGMRKEEMPWQNWMNREIHHWLAVYHNKLGHLGYIGCFSRNYHDKQKRLDWFVVLNKDFVPIGCITPYGRTYRFVSNLNYERAEYIGTYTTNEALEHLFGVAKVTDCDTWYFYAVRPQAKLPLHSPIVYTGLTYMPERKRAKKK